MKIDNPLMTGKTLEALKFQATILNGQGLQLGTEAFPGSDKIKQLIGSFSSFTMNVRDFIGKSISTTPNISEANYKPNYKVLRQIEDLNFGITRHYVITSVPDTDALMKDWLGYMDLLTDVVSNVIRFTIPGAIEYFTLVLEDVDILSSASASSAIDRLSTNKYALEQMNKKYPGIVKRNDKLLARTTMGAQYNNMKEFAQCQELMTEIVKRSGGISVVQASKDINKLNEIISRVIMIVNKKKELELDESLVKRVSDYLYNFAEEVALIAAYATFLDTTMVTLSKQVEDIRDQAGI